jgi:hypothetical protein
MRPRRSQTLLQHITLCPNPPNIAFKVSREWYGFTKSLYRHLTSATKDSVSFLRLRDPLDNDAELPMMYLVLSE